MHGSFDGISVEKIYSSQMAAQIMYIEEVSDAKDEAQKDRNLGRNVRVIGKISEVDLARNR